MPIQDSSPERRNLLLISLSILVFYLAEGEFKDSEVKLQVVNVHFNNSETLVVIVWLLLAWFAFRYWQRFRGEVSEAISSSIKEGEKLKLYKFYLEKFHKENRHIDRQCSITCEIDKPVNEWVMNYKFVTSISIGKDGYIRSYSPPSEWNDENNSVKLNIAFKIFFFPYLVVRAAIYNPEILTLVVPYLLFIAAIIAGIWN